MNFALPALRVLECAAAAALSDVEHRTPELNLSTLQLFNLGAVAWAKATSPPYKSGANAPRPSASVNN
ncbi:MAG: hypothetical protein DME20_04150 [Verrucomicrobia bacterium]|nr:MAG: hypothetical protein DME71_07085 [Verrucomicrobiota bacterium]PYK50454.1 MAG: hypothetical protein DME20_04150 [Verrucomicrobiota bacterium]